MIPGKRYTPEVVLAVGWRRKWLILIPTVVVALIACGVTYLLPNKYRAETAILVVPQRVPESYGRSTVATKAEDRLGTISQQVRSRTRLERIIEDFNLYPERRKRDIMQDIVDDMSDDIDVDVRGDVFRIAFTSDNPRTAMLVTERLGAFFVDESVKDRTMLGEDASELLDAPQVADAGRTLREIEQFRILDAAWVPERPFGPNRPILYLFGVMLALAVGVSAAAGAEYFDYGLRSVDDVRLALGLPVLATIPVIGTQKNSSLRVKVLGGSAAAAAHAVAVGAAGVVLRRLSNR